MKNTLFIIPLFFTIISCKEPQIKSKEIYLKETKSLLNSGKTDEILIIDSKPLKFDNKDCVKSILSDTKNFNKNDIVEIKEQIKKPFIDKWSDSFFDNGKVISNDTIKDIFKENNKKGWKYFYKKIGKRFITISSPIFFRNYTCCLLHIENDCGDLCGNGSVYLYKKVNGKWSIIKLYCPWSN